MRFWILIMVMASVFSKGFIYDLELDVSTASPVMLAAKIKAFIQEHPSPKALEELSNKES